MIFFLSLFALYVYTLYPSVSPYRDSGDMITSAFTLGVAHPSGYPLYALAGKVFALVVPFASVAYRINLMSAAFGAAAVAILASRFKGVGRWAFLALGFSAPFWRLSLVSEMYSLNALFAAAVALIMLGNLDAKKIALAAFVAGLACANHLTALFLVPAAGIAAIFSGEESRREIFKVKNITLYAALFILGCSVYIYLPIRASSGAVINWGDPSTPARIWRVVTRADYGGLKLHPEESEFSWTLSSAAAQVFYYFRLMFERFGAVILLFAVAGAASAFLAPQALTAFALTAFAVSGPLFSLLANLPVGKPSTPGILEPHFVMPDVFLAILAASGAGFLAVARSRDTLSVAPARKVPAKKIPAKKIPAKKIIVFAALIIASSAILRRTFPSCFYRADFHAHDYARNVLATARPGAIIYDPDDTTAFATDYYQYVLGRRTDVKKAVYFRTRWGYERLKRLHPDILPSGEITSGRELAEVIISRNKGSKMILAELPSKFPSSHDSRPLGIMHELIAPEPGTITTYRTGASPSLENYFVFYVTRGMPRLGYCRDFFSEHLVSYYSSALTNTGLYRADRRDFARARRLYLEALSISGDSSAAWNNLGTLYFGSGDYKSAAMHFEVAYRLEPANSSSKVNAGLAYSRLGDFNRARSSFEEALRKNFNPTAANELGLMHYARGDYASAEKIFSDIIARAPAFSAARYNMGLALSKTRPSEAQRYFEEYERMTGR